MVLLVSAARAGVETGARIIWSRVSFGRVRSLAISERSSPTSVDGLRLKAGVRDAVADRWWHDLILPSSWHCSGHRPGAVAYGNTSEQREQCDVGTTYPVDLAPSAWRQF